MPRGTPGEVLPAPHDDIDINGIELKTDADPAGHLGRDQSRARAEKRVVDCLTESAVVDNRAAHAFDRLLRAVPPALFALMIAKWVVVGDFPDRRLGAAALPVAGLAFPHGVPAGLVLPVIIATAQCEMLLRPHDLSAQLQSASRQSGADDVAVHGPMPDIGDIACKQCKGVPPVGAIIIEHRAARTLAGTKAAARPPGRLVANPVRRIGDHQVRLRSLQNRRDIRRAGAVAAANPVVSQQPYVAEPADRLIEDFRDAVRIRQTARSRRSQNGFELIRLETDQVEAEAAGLDVRELATQPLEVPARPRAS